MRTTTLEAATRYIRRFEGWYGREWIDYDENHVKCYFLLLDPNENPIAKVEIPSSKPLPKSTLLGHLIAMAIGAI